MRQRGVSGVAIAVAALMLGAPGPSSAQVQNVAATKHNLSVSGPGPIRATAEQEVCVFCHTPHASRPVAPLWNHDTSTTTYTMYQSSSFRAASSGPYLPSGSSVLCLSCHDGTVALGALRSRTEAMAGTGAGGVMPLGASNLTANLRDDHPFSFPYSAASPSDPELRTAPSLPVLLEDGKVQCASCHEPHLTSARFLRASVLSGSLCLNCHAKPNWGAGTHATSSRLFHADTTVAQMACLSCHRVHSAAHPARLLARDSIETTCYQCHGRNSTIATDIQTEMGRASAHRVSSYESQHEPVTVNPPLENSPTTTKHVECTDCHDGHRASGAAPSGRIQNVMGVSTSGTPVRLTSADPEYLLCFRCHAFGGEVVTGTGDDKYVHFGTAAPASGSLDGTTLPKGFHPVVQAGRGDPAIFNVALSGGLTSASTIRCSDCHASQTTASDSGAVDRLPGQVEGPHGSANNYLLRGSYTVATCLATLNSQCQPYASPDGSAFGLCFACHRVKMWTDQAYTATNFRRPSWNLHRHHSSLSGCPECHYDGHSNVHATTHTDFTNIAAGLSQYARQSTHLINFAPSVSGIPNTSKPRWTYDSGTQKFGCYLNCHGKPHDTSDFTYP